MRRLSNRVGDVSDLATFNAQVLLPTSIGNNVLPSNLIPLFTAWAEHESSNADTGQIFSSPVYQATNNAFGYGPVSGDGYQVGTYETYAMYNSVADSVQENIDYLFRRQADGSFPDLTTIAPGDAATFAQLLKNAQYYTDTVANYTAGLQNYLSVPIIPGVDNSTLLVGVGIGAVILLGIIIFGNSSK
jgi:hypothetical protein